MMLDSLPSALFLIADLVIVLTCDFIIIVFGCGAPPILIAFANVPGAMNCFDLLIIKIYINELIINYVINSYVNLLIIGCNVFNPVVIPVDIALVCGVPIIPIP